MFFLIFTTIIITQINSVVSFANSNFFNNWHCIGIVENINFKKPYKINIGELPLVVWKNKNNKLLTSINICKHMASRLDNGIITSSGNLQCQYHGLEYSEKDAFGETMEFNGKIFWALDPIHKVPYSVPFFNNEKYEKSFLEIDMNCDFRDSALNTMDLLHPEYVHSKIVGFGSKIPPSNIKNYYFNNSTLGLSFDYSSNKLISKLNENSKMTQNFHMFKYPSFSWSRVTYEKKNNIIISVNLLPIAPKKTKWFITICHNYYLAPLQKQFVKLMATTILTQDFLQMNNQFDDNALKRELLFTHKFNNEDIVLKLEEMIKDYEYPNINVVAELYRKYKK